MPVESNETKATAVPRNYNGPPTHEYYVDGGCRGNHARGERQAYGSYCGTDLAATHFDLPAAQTNNEAEYLSLIRLLEHLRDAGDDAPRAITIYTDSNLMVGHLMVGYKVKAPNLRALVEEARVLLIQVGAVLEWREREEIVWHLGH